MNSLSFRNDSVNIYGYFNYLVTYINGRKGIQTRKVDIQRGRARMIPSGDCGKPRWASFIGHYWVTVAVTREVQMRNLLA
jgi:hypothetical protein